MIKGKTSYNKRRLFLWGGILLAGTLLSALLFLSLSLNSLNAAPPFSTLPGMEVSAEHAAMLQVENTPSSAVETSVEVSIPASAYMALEVGQVLRLPQRDTSVVIYGGKAGLNKVALTFDSGWLYEPTPDLLQALADARVHATFFLRGGWVDANPELVRQIKAGGHEIGNHTYTHNHMPDQSTETLRDELNSTREAQYLLVGPTQDYYRPPYGEVSERDVVVAGEEGYRFTVLWTVDSIDWTEPGQDEILERVGQKLQDGGIALMHVGVWDTSRVIPRVIKALRERGLEPVPLSEIIDWEAFPCEEYQVQVGDTIEMLAEKWRVTEEVIVRLNPVG